MPSYHPREYKLITLRERPCPQDMILCDRPDKAAAYWRAHIIRHPAFSPDTECLFVLLLNSRRGILGLVLVATGTLDTMLVHPREVFRTVIVANSTALLLARNHPSGESAPSESDIKVTRDLVRAGRLLKIEVPDHVIIGAREHCSLREMGYLG